MRYARAGWLQICFRRIRETRTRPRRWIPCPTLESAAAILVHGLLVERRLRARQETERFDLGLVGQVGDDRPVGLESTQQVRLDQPAQRGVGLVRPRRQSLHESAELAGRAEQARIQKVIDRPQIAQAILDRANRKAIKLNAMVEAKAYFVEAMRLLDALPDTEANGRRRVALIANQIPVFLLLFQLVEYYEHLTRFEPVAVGLDEPSSLGAYYGRMSWGEWGLGRFHQAIYTASRAAELCEAAGNTEDAAQAYMILQYSYVPTGEYEQVLSLEPRVARAMERRFNLRTHGYSLAAMGRACAFLGRCERAIEFGEKQLRIAEEYADGSMISFALFILAWAYIYKGDCHRALEASERAARVAPTTVNQSWAEAALGVAHCRLGNANTAGEILARLLPKYRAARFIPSETYTPYLGEAYWLAGEYEKGQAVLEELLPIIEPCGMRFPAGVSHRILGEIAARIDPAQAAFHFNRSVAVLAEIKAEPELALAYAGYGRFHEQQGRIAEARDYLTRALEIFERLGTLSEPDKVRRELAELPVTGHTRESRVAE